MGDCQCKIFNSSHNFSNFAAHNAEEEKTRGSMNPRKSKLAALKERQVNYFTNVDIPASLRNENICALNVGLTYTQLSSDGTI